MGANDKAEATYHGRTPDTDMMRGRYIDGKQLQSKFHHQFFIDANNAGEEFDRWLKQVKAEAWDEAYRQGRSDQAEHSMYTQKYTANPYKED